MPVHEGHLEGVFEGSGIAIEHDYIEADSEDVIRELVAAGKGSCPCSSRSDADAMVREAGTAVICETSARPCCP